MRLPLLLALLACQGAVAQSAAPALPRVVPDASGGAAAAEAFRKLPVCTLAPDGMRLAVEPCRPAPTQSFAQRRSVPQAIIAMPPSAARAPQYRPPTAMPAPSPLPSPLSSPLPHAIQPLRGCDAGGCRDAGGTRYQGTGPVVLDPAGRPCRTDGNWVQC
ncbi:hypothetical protein LJR289_003356 [Pseudoduganella sp. LjRoot289]|uniref:hypothetical protein n=1 Tax=Pseudoduganella sp. LjRoot289 TaxID=3342314 RepID=UPI003ECE0C93